MDRNHYRKLRGRQGVAARSHTHHTAGISSDGKASDRPRAHYVKLSSGGNTLGISDRPHATASIDPKGNGRMRGTAADRSVHHPWVLLSGGTGDRNAATEPKGCKAEGQTRRYPYGKAEK